MNSCLYHGTVMHRRQMPVEHRFRYRLWMAYLDLAELPELVGPQRLIADRRFSPASFLRTDHFGDPALPMADAVRAEVLRQTGMQITGPIRLLTLLRQWGYYFSPINVFYCFNNAGELACALAEVSNTPWRERHLYSLWPGNRAAAETTTIPGEIAPNAASPPTAMLRYEHAKEFHVSPFLGMDATYHWSLRPPADRLSVSITSRSGGEELFHAGMELGRVELNRANLRRALFAAPIVPAKVLAAIYWQAMRLWMKRCPFFPHPKLESSTNMA